MRGSRDDPLAFARPIDLADWLAENHDTSRELWVRIYKKGSGYASVTWEDCVVEAIRYGWIDGIKQSGDEKFYLQRLTPRRPGSNWSAKNREHAERIIEAGRITPAGLAHVDAARADGRWETAYGGSATMTMPADFLEALAKRPNAKTFFHTLDRRNLYAIYYRLQTAKTPATRARRMEVVLDRLSRGELFH
ncbi:YdeI family protein [Sphingomonas sp. BK580]|uniref:YdeI/OmpD-associated family protein n=1 Tax=Sphingomonas sp. BK580 TaxID=2586972 RepID=UPI00162311A6|nr:YdeI/OmpD-associated family protein [Sphingomonas sp. BK580]MBB3693573.1 uncharacterized protein YdeI (YjbR/CyaY-like superfamily) [Sphingomonas sp. BK580]